MRHQPGPDINRIIGEIEGFRVGDVVRFLSFNSSLPFVSICKITTLFAVMQLSNGKWERTISLEYPDGYVRTFIGDGSLDWLEHVDPLTALVMFGES